MLHAYDGTGQDQPPAYNTTIAPIANSSISLADGHPPYSATPNNGARFLLNVDLEAIIYGVSYKFYYGSLIKVNIPVGRGFDDGDSDVSDSWYNCNGKSGSLST